MEQISQQSIKYKNDSRIDVDTYYVDSVTDLKEGTIFGVVVSKRDMAPVIPVVEFIDGELTYYFTGDFQAMPNSFNTDSNVFNDDAIIPLIFKKTSGNEAQELLSGEIFRLAINDSKDMDGLDDFDIGLERFQKDAEMYSNNNVFIFCDAQVYNKTDEYTNGIIVVNDFFKSLYSRDTLPYKDEIIKTLKSIKQQSKSLFVEGLKSGVNVSREVAETENLIYDIEHTNEDKPKTM